MTTWSRLLGAASTLTSRNRDEAASYGWLFPHRARAVAVRAAKSLRHSGSDRSLPPMPAPAPPFDASARVGADMVGVAGIATTSLVPLPGEVVVPRTEFLHPGARGVRPGQRNAGHGPKDVEIIARVAAIALTAV